MPLGDFRSVLPSCTKKLDDGAFVILNREYKPLGFNSRTLVKYEDYPICSKIEGLTPAIIKKIAYDGVA